MFQGMPGQQQRPSSETIWEGELQWRENVKTGPATGEKPTHTVRCHVTSNRDANSGSTEVKSDSWPKRLILQLIPKNLAQSIDIQFYRNSKSVLFYPEPSESLDALTRVLSSGYAGCVHFTGGIKVHMK